MATVSSLHHESFILIFVNLIKQFYFCNIPINNAIILIDNNSCIRTYFEILKFFRIILYEYT